MELNLKGIDKIYLSHSEKVPTLDERKIKKQKCRKLSLSIPKPIPNRLLSLNEFYEFIYHPLFVKIFYQEIPI